MSSRVVSWGKRAWASGRLTLAAQPRGVRAGQSTQAPTAWATTAKRQSAPSAVNAAAGRAKRYGQSGLCLCFFTLVLSFILPLGLWFYGMMPLGNVAYNKLFYKVLCLCWQWGFLGRRRVMSNLTSIFDKKCLHSQLGRSMMLAYEKRAA